MTEEQVIALLARECEKAGSQLAWAKANKLSAPYVGDVLRGRREPGKGILVALGLEKVVTYRRVKK
jgi:hypothetical protein